MPWQAPTSVVICSLLETANANRWEPYTWLCRALRDLPAAKTVDDVAALLPCVKDMRSPDLTSGAPSWNSLGVMDRLLNICILIWWQIAGHAPEGLCCAKSWYARRKPLAVCSASPAGGGNRHD
jgi:hypothetical protein